MNKIWWRIFNVVYWSSIAGCALTGLLAWSLLLYKVLHG